MKLNILLLAALAAFASGLLLSIWNPLIRRVWTTSFTLYSTGWVLLMFLAFFWLIEVKGYRRFAFPFLVVGMNSIFIYCVSLFLGRWLNKSLRVFTAGFRFLDTLAPIGHSCTVLLVMWCLCYWLYRRNIAIKL